MASQGAVVRRITLMATQVAVVIKIRLMVSEWAVVHYDYVNGVRRSWGTPYYFNDVTRGCTQDSVNDVTRVCTQDYVNGVPRGCRRHDYVNGVTGGCGTQKMSGRRMRFPT